MKKTLVTLALASLAASAFANTSFYSYSDDNSSANLHVNGYARQTFDFGKYNLHAAKGSQLTDYTGVNSFDKSHKTSQTKARVEIGGDFSDKADLTVGFNTRFEYVRHNDAFRVSKLNYVNTDNKWENNNYVNGLALKRAYGYISHAKFGTLTVGKTVSLLDNKWGDDLEYLGDANKYVFKTAIHAQTEFPLVFNYAYKYNPVSVAVGFAKDRKAAEGEHTHQYALQLNYVDPFASNWQFVYANTQNTLNGENHNTLNSYDLSVTNGSLVKDLVLSANVAHEDERLAKHLRNDDHALKAARTSVGVKASYTLNQYFKPYAGYTYVYEKDSAEVGSVKHKTKSHYAYVGASSNVWNYKTVGVDVFGELGYNHDKHTVSENGQDKNLGYSTSDKIAALGVKFNF